MESSIPEEESGSDKDSAPESGETEVASENEAPQPFSKKVRWWGVFAVLVVASVVFMRMSVPPEDYGKDLALVNFSRVAQLFFSFVWFGLFFLVLRKFPLWVRGIVLFLFFLPAAFSMYLWNFYGMEIQYNFVVDCLNTHWEEARAFISLHAVGTLIGFVAVMFAVAWLIGKTPAKFPKSKIFVVGLIVVLTVSAYLPRTFRTCIYPVQVARLTTVNLLLYSGGEEGLDKLARQEAELQEVERVPTEISHVKAVPVVVLHIGETARADHAPFNGYGRNTMPNMLREYEAGNLISFPKCVSFAVNTPTSMRGILTPSTVLENEFHHPTFIPALNQNGVETCGFISAYVDLTGDKNLCDAWCVKIVCALQEIVSTSDPALVLLPKIREKIAEDEKKEPLQERFYFYYGEGSHEPFIHYDYDRHSVFKPTGKRKYGFGDERDVNNYDNTFIAVDEFCGGFIDALRNENAVYIFVGDHGTMLGEDGLQGRPFKRKEARHVLFFIWASDKFKAENPELWATLLRNRERLGVISHDFVYNSVLHLFSLKTPFYDEKADLFSDSAEPFPTEMPDAEKSTAEMGGLGAGAEMLRKLGL